MALLLIIRFLFPQKNFQDQIEELQSKTQPNIDATVNKIIAENRFFNSINYLINSGQFDGADKVITKLIAKNEKNDYYWTLKGNLFHARKMYDSALHYYNYAIILNPNSGAIFSRPLTYIKTNKYNDAIADYKRAYEKNDSYSYKLAEAFELNDQGDSAIKYYQIYLDQYTDSVYEKLNQEGIHLEYPPDSAREKIRKLYKR